jgi:hypothetical protein
LSAPCLVRWPPLEPANYRLKFDMVAEGVARFEAYGSRPVVRDLEVR